MTPSAVAVDTDDWLDRAAILEAKNPIALLKSAIARHKNAIEEALREGASIEGMLARQCCFTDTLINLCWSRFSWDENLSSWRKTRIALVAVGGYGRRELMPHSDIDLLILSERDNLQKHAANIQSFTTLLWDIGLEVGHSVRSLGDAFNQAKNDVTIMTSMLDARILCGSPVLLDRLEKRLERKKCWRVSDFY